MSASPRSATARTQLPVPSELLLRVLDHVSDDRLNVFQCLLVSKQFYAVANRIWMRHLDLPLSKLPKLVDCLQRGVDNSSQAASEGLGLEHGFQFIKTIRIWDDVLCARYKRQRHSRRRQSEGYLLTERLGLSQDEDGAIRDAYWGATFSALCEYLVHASDRHKGALPDFDLSFGILSASALKDTLQLHASIAERIVGMRVRAIDTASLRNVSATSTSGLDDITGLWSADLVKMLQSIVQRQRSARSLSLATFSIEQCDFSWGHSDSIDVKTFTVMGQELHHTIEALSLDLSFGGVHNASCHALFQEIWPRLRSCCLLSADDRVSLHPAIEDFLANHQDQLEEVALEVKQNTFAFRPWSLEQTFHKLRRFVIGYTTADAFSAFLGRHPHLVDLSIRGPILGESVTELPNMPNLRILRGDVATSTATMARELLMPRGSIGSDAWTRSSVAHLQLDLDSARHLRDIVPVDSLFGFLDVSLSCLDITVQHSLCDTIRSLERCIDVSLFHLQELSITSLFAPKKRTQHSSGAVQSYEILRHALRSFERAVQLIHLRLDLQVAHRLLEPRRLEFLAHQVPPALHLLTWHIPAINETQYLRVIRRSAPTASGEEEPQCGLVPISAHMAGVRERTSGMFWDENVLLDHTQQPPLPPPFAGFKMSIKDP
ncbi:hypothetical protein OC835_001575 [Tilletia horrida]|nr:hypothetical protein OC835_001575 [Tilletia horrida]